MIKAIKTITIILQAIILVIELLPIGIPIYALDPETMNYNSILYSYFSPTILLYYNITPAITALTSVIALLLGFVWIIKRNKKQIILKYEMICIVISAISAIVTFIITPTLVTILVAFMLLLVTILLFIFQQS